MIYSTKQELGSKYNSSIKRNSRTGETITTWLRNTIMWEKLR